VRQDSFVAQRADNVLNLLGRRLWSLFQVVAGLLRAIHIEIPIIFHYTRSVRGAALEAQAAHSQQLQQSVLLYTALPHGVQQLFAQAHNLRFAV
jgi:hypothetical protein